MVVGSLQPFNCPQAKYNYFFPMKLFIQPATNRIFPCCVQIIMAQAVANFLSEQKKNPNNDIAAEWGLMEELYNEKYV